MLKGEEMMSHILRYFGLILGFTGSYVALSSLDLVDPLMKDVPRWIIFIFGVVISFIGYLAFETETTTGDNK